MIVRPYLDPVTTYASDSTASDAEIVPADYKKLVMLSEAKDLLFAGRSAGYANPIEIA